MDSIFFWLIALLVAALLLIWLLCFPDVREALWRRLRHAFQRVTGYLSRRRRQSSNVLQHASRNARDGTSQWVRRLLQHHKLLLALGLLMLLPAVLVISTRHHVMLDGYSTSGNTDEGTSELVASLLKGEQLVPPPALPPAVFITREVQIVRPDLGSANRKWDKLDPDFRQRLLAVFKIMKERYGYDMALIEGYRSPERQNELAAQGSNVTNAGAYQSYHQYGLAADNGFYRDGKLVISEKDPWAMRGYQLYGKVAEAAGLVWGGRWKMMDLGHTELHKPGAGPHRR
ncbi:MAG: M15 family metallopeptidase [Rhodanobacter sp.]